MTKKQIFFFGTPEIAVPSLEKLSHLPSVEIAGVGVFPDRKIGRKQVLTPCPVKLAAKKLALPVFEIHNKQDLIHIFETQKIDLGLVIAFGMIFPKKALEMPNLGVINIHFSLLPKYRGASPVQSAILHGDKVSGITFQKMVRKLDAGDILLQKEYNIENKKTSELFNFFAEESAEMLPEFFEAYFKDQIVPQKQEESNVTTCGLFERKDGECFPEKETAEEIYRKYLAFDLFPGVFIKTEKGSVKLAEVSLSPTQTSHPLDCTNNTTLHLQKAQIPGKQEMLIQEILKGTPNLF